MKLAKTLAVAGFLALGANANAACPRGTTDLGTMEGKKTCLLKGRYTRDLTLQNKNNYVLQGGVFIGNNNKQNTTLTIQAGTKVVGSSGADFLVITRGSKIKAQGTRNAPIVFTAAKTSGRSRGEWGGLIINGNAPINNCKTDATFCEAEGEGSTGLYGGNNAYDNSGVLKYVRVEFAGYEITPENELNGISFQGVGSGTTVDYIQVHMNADDGVEFFGGTVNAKHVVLTGNKDDSLDWTSGYRGKLQYVLIQQYDDAANNGIEGDNLKSPMDAEPRSMPEISNMTLLGTTGESAKGGEGMLLRKGTGAIIHNTIITGFKKSCIDIDDEATFLLGATVNGESVTMTGLQMYSTLVHCPGKNFKLIEKDKEGNVVKEPWNIQKFFRAGAGNKERNPMLNGHVPMVGSPALGTGVTPMDLFFDEVDYVGAVKNSQSDWTEGWTTSASN